MVDLEFVFKEKIEIKLLILYILHQSKAIAMQEDLERQFLVDFCMEYIKISYFDLQECISEILEDGIILGYTKNHRDILSLTEKGEFMLNQFLKMVPYSVRDTIDNKIYESVAKHNNERAVLVDYWNENNNCYTTMIRITENDSTQMQFMISFSNKYQAQALSHQFKKHPDEFYKKVLEICDEAINKDLEENKESN